MARPLYGFYARDAMRFLLLITLLLPACGQIGPLVLPEKKPAEKTAPPPPSAPEDVERQKKQTVPPGPNP
jgi:predicted small lipoprotein YifL